MIGCPCVNNIYFYINVGVSHKVNIQNTAKETLSTLTSMHLGNIMSVRPC